MRNNKEKGEVLVKKTLYRSKEDVKISGVCGGLAEYLGIDSTIMRLLWILCTLFTGGMIGLIMYVACVFLIPEESEFIDAEYKEK